MTSWRLFTFITLTFVLSTAWAAPSETTPQATTQPTHHKPFAVQPQETAAPSSTSTAAPSPSNQATLVTQQPAPPVAAAPQGTQIQLYVPFEGSQLVESLSIKKQVRGLCVGSVVDERKGAWRCLSAGNVYDPCFKRPKNGYGVFACAKTPWDTSVTLVTASDYPKNGNKNTNLEKATPWALELANHHQCVLLTGATGLLNGLRMNYRCDDDAYVLGDIDKTKDFWRVKFGSMKSNHVARVDIKTAWY